MKNIIRGRNVRLSHFKDDYVQFITDNQWDNEFNRNYYWDVVRPYGYEEWIDFFKDRTSDSRFLFAILENKTDQFIGWISLSEIQLKNRGAELSIVILLEENRGKGYGIESLNLICEFGFSELGLHKLKLYVNSNNINAIKLYEKCGFQKEGTDRESLYQDGKWLDRYYYGLLHTEWVDNT